jgi:hypothetical protein
MRPVWCLGLAVLFFVFSNSVFAQPEKPLELHINIYANPRLVGVNNLWVDIKADYNSVVAYSLPTEQIRNKCSEKLKESGIFVETRNPAFSSFSEDYKIPYLTIHIVILDNNTPAFLTFYSRVSLLRMVSLTTEKGTIQFKAEVWESEPVIESALKQDLSEVLTDTVLKQVDSFISVWSIANTTDVNQPRPQSEKTNIKKDTKSVKQQDTETKYVASKNSKVFHKADCQFAKRIKPENLVIYNTRDEAIKAGKNPCKTCNP